jgi:hypothetical protein
MGRAGSGSASEAVLVMESAPLSSPIGGATGTVRAHTGVVSCVGTAVAGGSGGVDSSGLAGTLSKSMVSLAPRVRSVSADQANTLFNASSGTGSG